MTNSQAAKLAKLITAREHLIDYIASLEAAQAATSPQVKLDQLTTARADHQQYQAALINANFAEINALLAPLIGTVVIDWSGRGGSMSAIRAELEACTIGYQYIDLTCLAMLGFPELEEVIHDKATAEINARLGTQFEPLEPFDPGNLSNVDLALAYQFLVDEISDPDDLDDLTIKLASTNAQALAAYPAMNAALKQRIISAVNDIVGFEYNGMNGAEALPVQNNDQFIAWTHSNVSARLLYLNIPFRYNRSLAAAKAVELAGQGDRGSQSTGVLDGISFQSGSGLTDSARFISLSLRAGGIPMMTTGQVNTCDPNVPVGWCVSPPPVGTYLLQDNLIWRNHNQIPNPESTSTPVNLAEDTRLAAFLLGNPEVRGSGIQSFYLIDGLYSDNAQNYASLSIDDVIGKTSNGDTYAPEGYPTQEILEISRYATIGTNLSSLSNQLAPFGIGDYVVTLGESAHGFMITGKQTAIKCASSPSAGATISELNIPYVADLPGTQDGDPRPFYCTRIPEDFSDDLSFFRFVWWYFIKVPDLWLIEFQRLYPDPLP